MNHPFENIPKRKPDTKTTVYTEKFERWLQESKENGLLYVNIFYKGKLNKDTVNYESFCEEFIRMNEAPDVEDNELF